MTHVAGTERAPASDCGYTLDYTAQWRTYYNTVIALPAFIVWDHVNLRFEVQTDDPSHLTSVYNTYDIELVASTRLADTDPVVTWT